MSNSATTSRIQDIIRRVRSEASSAERAFDRANDSIQRQASYSINIYGGDATNRVANIARDVRRACDDLYSTYQSLVRTLDESCRPLLDQDPALSAVKEVRDLIKWLNDESEIENNFTASFNSYSLGDVASTRYMPSMESKMIQRYWENKYTMWPGRAEQEAKERAEAEERRRVQEELRRKQEEQNRLEFQQKEAQYEKDYAAWEEQKRKIEQQRSTELTRAIAQEKKSLDDATQKAHKNAVTKLRADLADYQAKKTTAENTLPTLGFFAFSAKSENKKTIKLMTEKIAQAEAAIAANEQWYQQELSKNKQKISDREKELREKLEKRFPIPAAPRKPIKPFNSYGASPVSMANQAVKEDILACMEPGVLYTVVDIQQECPSCADLTNQRVSALMRQLMTDGLVDRVEEKRKAFFRLAE